MSTMTPALLWRSGFEARERRSAAIRFGTHAASGGDDTPLPRDPRRDDDGDSAHPVACRWLSRTRDDRFMDRIGWGCEDISCAKNGDSGGDGRRISGSALPTRSRALRGL